MLILLALCAVLHVVVAFPTGQHVRGHCVYQNEHISFVWDYKEPNNFFYLQPLQDQPYKIERKPKANYFYFPKDYYLYVATEYGRASPGKLKYLEEEYQHIHHNFTRRNEAYDFVLFLPDTNKPRSMAIFHNVITNSFGLITNPTTCEFVRNGGCVFMKHTKIYGFTGNKQTYSKVVSLTGGASGTWHFPMELFVGLAGLNATFLQQPDLYFHVTANTHYVQSWFQLLNISWDRILDSNHVIAETLYVPQMGPCTGPFPVQQAWLRSLAQRHPEIGPIWQAQEAKQVQIQAGTVKPVVLLIHRTKSRALANAPAVQRTVQQFALESEYDFVLHQDTHLPSLVEQIKQFHDANIIVAPHGAGLLFTTFALSNVCIIEFLPPSSPPCYSRIAYIEQYHYLMYMMVDGSTIGIHDLTEGLKKCKELTHPTYHNTGLSEELSKETPVVPGISYI